VIAAVSNFTDTGDVTTLANPRSWTTSGTRCRRPRWARGDVPRGLTETEKAEIQSFARKSSQHFPVSRTDSQGGGDAARALM